jgi:hypothetical protein
MAIPLTLPVFLVSAAALLLAPDPAQRDRDKEKDKKGGTPARAAPPPPLAPWRGNLADARAAAKERNVPILVHVILEAESSNDAYRDKVLPDPDLLRRSVQALVIVANNGQHPPKRIEEVVEGQTTSREVCSVYPLFAQCQQHRAAWDEIYLEWREENGDLLCPQTVVLTPDGKLSGRINTRSAPEPSEVVALLADALGKAGPGLTEAQYAQVKQGLEEARRLASAADWAAAWKAWSGVLAVTQGGPWAEEARREQPKALAGLGAELERRAAGLVPGTAAQAFESLTAFAAEVAGTPVEKDVAARLKKAEADKAIRGEIQAWRLGREADALLREATLLTDAGETKKAERVIKKLLGPRYANTPAQATARQLWPDIP